MRIAQLQTERHATPSLALVVDGAYYDVGVLEQLWSCPAMWSHTDFHVRVVGARCAGLGQLDARLRAGQRPTEARLWPADMLPLPPCAPERSAYLQVAPYGEALEVPRYQRRDSRSLVGDGQPVPVRAAAGAPVVEGGLAVVLGDELYRATRREAERAILGVTLLLDWHASDQPWAAAGSAAEAPSQLGPVLWVGVSLSQLARQRALMLVGQRRQPAGRAGAWPHQPGELLCYLSQHTRLCAGDVIGLGCLPGGRVPRADAELGFGDRVRLELDGAMGLSGWATRAPEPLSWHR